MNKSRLLATVITCLMVINCAVTEAATVRYSFTAVIYQTGTTIIPDGEVFTGAYTADSTTFFDEPFGPRYALVGQQTISSSTIGFNSAIATSGGISVQNDRDAGAIDKLAPSAGFTGVGTGIRGYSWNTQDNDATILSDSSLPLSFPLSELEAAIFVINFKAGSGFCTTMSGTCFAAGTITQLAISQIPLPPALYLFATGLLGLIGIARRKHVT